MTGDAQGLERDPIARAAKLFDVVELPARGTPAHFAIALPGDDLLSLPLVPDAAMPHAGRMASGRGIDAAGARLSCLGEAAELFSCCAWGNEPIIAATAAELGAAAIPAGPLNGFGSGQIANRSAWNRAHASFDWQPAERDPERRIDWIAAVDAFTGGEAFVPADFAFIGRRRSGDRRAVAIGDSNGCAAGVDADMAKLAALLELVERDATGRWWYGRRRRPALDLASVSSLDPLAAWLSERSRRTFLFDITTDIGIAAFASASARPDGCDVALGFAARLERGDAALAAVAEMLQMEVSLETARLLGDTAGTWPVWRAEVSTATPPLSEALTPPARTAPLPPSGRAPRRNVAAALEALAARNIDLCFIDMTRTEIGVPVFRAVSAALCHYKPRFGKARLLAPDPGHRPRPAFAEQPLLLV